MATVTDHTYTLSGNIQIFFNDNGPPLNGSSDYTTLVVLHGTGFNGYGLKKLHGAAHRLNLRTVIWNRRGYPGSTSYTELELEDISKRPKVFVDKIGRQVAEFLVHFIEEENIPKATSDHQHGGIAIMGWSMGSLSAMALFSDPQLFSPETYFKLEPYLKDLVLYEPSHTCLGYELPTNPIYYYPLADPDLTTTQERYQQFRVWISSFFDHPNPDSVDPRFLAVTKTCGHDAIVTKWSTKELELYFNEEVAIRCEMPISRTETMQKSLREMTEQVFFDGKLIESYFPRLKITMVYGTKTAWHCLWVQKEFQRIYDGHVAGGESVRPLKSYKMDGANHFAHWEDPQLLLETVAEGIGRHCELSHDLKSKDSRYQ